MIKLVNAAFQVEAFFLNRPRTDLAQVEGHFADGHFLLAHLAGHLLASVYYEARGASGYIGMLAVHPEYERRGLARAIMQAAEQGLRREGCSVAQITVVDLRRELLPFYRKLGYREISVEEPRPDLQEKLTMPAKLIRMEKSLKN